MAGRRWRVYGVLVNGSSCAANLHQLRYRVVTMELDARLVCSFLVNGWESRRGLLNLNRKDSRALQCGRRKRAISISPWARVHTSVMRCDT